MGARVIRTQFHVRIAWNIPLMKKKKKKKKNFWFGRSGCTKWTKNNYNSSQFLDACPGYHWSLPTFSNQRDAGISGDQRWIIGQLMFVSQCYSLLGNSWKWVEAIQDHFKRFFWWRPAKTHCCFYWEVSYYRPRSEGDNALGSVCPSVCPSVCLGVRGAHYTSRLSPYACALTSSSCLSVCL